MKDKDSGKEIRLTDWQKVSLSHKKLYRQLLERISLRDSIRKLPLLHQEAFSKIDCLQCAACCRNYSPRFKTTDIKRISRSLKMKEGAFIEKYLKLDDEGDYVLHSSPCAFLDLDSNKCTIYDQRPGDCARYPYTDEDVLLKRRQITLANAVICPAVYYVLERLVQDNK